MGIEDQQLWQSTLGGTGEQDAKARERLRTSFLSFRKRIEVLVQEISGVLPGLTVHDITHLDALWRVAREIAGGDYPINPAEAYVLGGAFLLHDSAHSIAAYPGGLKQIKETVTWKDLVAQRLSGVEPVPGSDEERYALFHVLRQLHAHQAQELPHISWVDSSGAQAYLIEDAELRSYYGDVIGEVAASHHWPAHKVAEVFADRHLAAPAFLQPASWQVDVLKVALLLRTADAAHIDSLRAPWFLFALKQPQGISKLHWMFQLKMGQPTRNSDGYLIISSGSHFGQSERSSWWLAFDTVVMIDRELRDAYAILRDTGRQVFAAVGVLGSNSPESFARQVRTRDWEPFNVGPTVGDVPKLISALGGQALYGNDPRVPIRELLQNAMDAVRALRAVAGGELDEGEVEIGVDYEDEDYSWLRITDSGIGMSRHVLTNVLLDFGNSLWSSDAVRDELPGIASAGFRAVGNFGIGFYSVFMISDHVEVVSRRFERKEGDSSEHWGLVFDNGLSGRPLVSQPSGARRLRRQGTAVHLRIRNDQLIELLTKRRRYFHKPTLVEAVEKNLSALIGSMAPSSDIRLYSRIGDERALVVSPSDWTEIPNEELTTRVGTGNVRLHPLIEDGRLIGRLGLSSRRFMEGAAIVTRGLKCGEALGLSGLMVTSSNNSDARRSQIAVGGSLDSWRDWATRVIDDGPHSLYDLERLHPLRPDLDLRVWNSSGKLCTLAEIEEQFLGLDELHVHEGQITHEDFDEMGSDYFDEFVPEEGIICLPSPDKYDDAFPWFLPVSEVDYESVLLVALKSAWGEVEEEDLDEVLVGYVRGAEILRSVKVYRRITD